MIENDNIRKELILNLKKGEKGAFRELFNQYGPKIYRFALAYLKNKPDAEELMQDVFLKIWEKREHLDPSQNVKSYIFKIAVNCIYDSIRKKNLEKAFSDFSKHNFQPGSESLWHEVIWNDMLSNLNILVSKMPEQRRIIAQADIDAYIATLTLPDNEEAAQEMIINQKYLANFMGTCEPELDHVRTGYPLFDYPANMVDVGSRTMPRKLPWPEMETNTNKNCPTYIGTPQSPQNRVWWDTKVVVVK